MLKYILKRLLFIIPTLFFVILLNFTIVQFAPGGPVENMIAQLKGVGSNAGGEVGSSSSSSFNSTDGLSPELVAEIKRMYGFDKPAPERFKQMLYNYAHLDFGQSYYKNQSVIALISDKILVSISIGLWAIALIYFVSIPLGIRKAVKNGRPFDVWTSIVIIIAFSFPSFVAAILSVLLFGPNGMIADVFPLRGIVSTNWDNLDTLHKIKDYFAHIALPVFAIALSGFATLTMLTKNAFLE
jgi:microcin C transport system permease protein